MSGEYVTLKEAAAIIGISWQYAYDWARAGYLGAMISPGDGSKGMQLLRQNVESARDNWPTERRQNRRGSQKALIVIEDAGWLAVTGETADGAVRRLGFGSWSALSRMLWRHDRSDLIEKFVRNSHERGISVDGKILDLWAS